MFTLSMTASSFLFLQHEQYIIYNEKKKRRSRGIYDPSLKHVLTCTFFYMCVNVPRQLANALIFSISPIFAIIMMAIELGIHLWYSNYNVRRLNNNLAFPSGTVTALTNFVSVCGPFRLIGKLNLFSNILLFVKVVMLYPITISETLTIANCNDCNPGRIRCWNETDLTTPSSSNITEHTNMQDLRICSLGESTNDYLFNTILPLTLCLLVFFSMPFGYLISNLMTKVKLASLDRNIKNAVAYCTSKFEVTETSPNR